MVFQRKGQLIRGNVVHRNFDLDRRRNMSMDPSVAVPMRCFIPPDKHNDTPGYQANGQAGIDPDVNSSESATGQTRGLRLFLAQYEFDQPNFSDLVSTLIIGITLTDIESDVACQLL